MTATIIDGKARAAILRARVGDAVAHFRAAAGWVPGLVVLVGAAASSVYVRNKAKATREAEMDGFEHGFHPVNAGRLATGIAGFVPCTPLGCLLSGMSISPGSARWRVRSRRCRAASGR